MVVLKRRSWRVDKRMRVPKRMRKRVPKPKRVRKRRSPHVGKPKRMLKRMRKRVPKPKRVLKRMHKRVSKPKKRKSDDQGWLTSPWMGGLLWTMLGLLVGALLINGRYWPAAHIGPDIECFEVAAEVLVEVLDPVTPRPVAAVVAMPERSLDSVAEATGPILMAVELRDPGNLGTIMRSAEAASIQ